MQRFEENVNRPFFWTSNKHAVTLDNKSGFILTLTLESFSLFRISSVDSSFKLSLKTKNYYQNFINHCWKALLWRTLSRIFKTLDKCKKKLTNSTYKNQRIRYNSCRIVQYFKIPHVCINLRHCWDILWMFTIELCKVFLFYFISHLICVYINKMV